MHMLCYIPRPARLHGVQDVQANNARKAGHIHWTYVGCVGFWVVMSMVNRHGFWLRKSVVYVFSAAHKTTKSHVANSYSLSTVSMFTSSTMVCKHGSPGIQVLPRRWHKDLNDLNTPRS